MTLLNNWLAALPFMNAERADYVISSFWPMLEAAVLYTLPLAVISFFCGLLIAVIVAVIRTLPHPSAPIKLLQALCRIYTPPTPASSKIKLLPVFTKKPITAVFTPPSASRKRKLLFSILFKSSSERWLYGWNNLGSVDKNQSYSAVTSKSPTIWRK